jgi:hypothetical protein
VYIQLAYPVVIGFFKRIKYWAFLAAMLDFSDEASEHEKCYTTIGQLPVFVDPKQPPRKKSPFSTILGHPVLHTVIDFLATFVVLT